MLQTKLIIDLIILHKNVTTEMNMREFGYHKRGKRELGIQLIIAQVWIELLSVTMCQLTTNLLLLDLWTWLALILSTALKYKNEWIVLRKWENEIDSIGSTTRAIVLIGFRNRNRSHTLLVKYPTISQLLSNDVIWGNKYSSEKCLAYI